MKYTAFSIPEITQLGVYHHDYIRDMKAHHARSFITGWIRYSNLRSRKAPQYHRVQGHKVNRATAEEVVTMQSLS